MSTLFYFLKFMCSLKQSLLKPLSVLIEGDRASSSDHGSAACIPSSSTCTSSCRSLLHPVSSSDPDVSLLSWPSERLIYSFDCCHVVAYVVRFAEDWRVLWRSQRHGGGVGTARSPLDHRSSSFQSSNSWAIAGSCSLTSLSLSASARSASLTRALSSRFCCSRMFPSHLPLPKNKITFLFHQIILQLQQ